MITFYNGEMKRFTKAYSTEDKRLREAAVDDFVKTDPTQISWTHNLKQDLVGGKELSFDDTYLATALYRPFNKQWMYYNRRTNERVYQMPRIFPTAATENVVIGVSASESRSSYSVFITDHVPSLHAVDMVGSQYFPLYLYDTTTPILSERVTAGRPTYFTNQELAPTNAGVTRSLTTP